VNTGCYSSGLTEDLSGRTVNLSSEDRWWWSVHHRQLWDVSQSPMAMTC